MSFISPESRNEAVMGLRGSAILASLSAKWRAPFRQREERLRVFSSPSSNTAEIKDQLSDCEPTGTPAPTQKQTQAQTDSCLSYKMPSRLRYTANKWCSSFKAHTFSSRQPRLLSAHRFTRASRTLCYTELSKQQNKDVRWSVSI